MTILSYQLTHNYLLILYYFTLDFIVVERNIVFEFSEKVYANFLSFTNTAATIAPKTGDVIIFPAHLFQKLYQNRGQIKTQNLAHKNQQSRQKP